MTIEQEKHLASCIARFTKALNQKYREGQRTHGGNVWLKPGMLREAMAEVLDQWVYLDSLRQQLEARDPEYARFAMGDTDSHPPRSFDDARLHPQPCHCGRLVTRPEQCDGPPCPFERTASQGDGAGV